MQKPTSFPSEIFLRSERAAERTRAAVHIERSLGRLAEFYGFHPLILSPFESPDEFGSLIKIGVLDERPPVAVNVGVGEQMLLRFSGALSALRSCVAHDLSRPARLFFSGPAWFGRDASDGPAFRNEGVLVIVGDEGAAAEVLLAEIAWNAIRELGVPAEAIEFRVHATGCGQCRPRFRSSLGSFLRSRNIKLCKVCTVDARTIPTRIFGCGEEECRLAARRAPQMLDFLCEACTIHLREFFECLDDAGVPYTLDGTLWRDRSWWQQLVFEFALRTPAFAGAEQSGHDQQNAQAHDSALMRGLLIGEGGRMDRAAEVLIGKKTEAAGMTLFFDALEQGMASAGIALSLPEPPPVFLAHLGDLAKRHSFRILELLRSHGIPVAEFSGRDAIKSQLKVAERTGAQVALILGQKEAIDQTIIVREVQSGMQETVPQEKLVEFLKKKLKR